MNLNWRCLCFHFTCLKFSVCQTDRRIRHEICSSFCLERFPQIQPQKTSPGVSKRHREKFACIGLSVGTANSSQNVSSPVKQHNVPLAEEAANVRSFQVSLLSCQIADKRELNCRSHFVEVTVLREKKDCCIISEHEFTCSIWNEPWCRSLFPSLCITQAAFLLKGFPKSSQP